ncbi:SpoIIE family protein phosphatase [Ammoniphilus sp. CFH 90114]|uniref:SpoIIE family protein phosphatase n=1 Tax=Ammoniphilus sp. CFH 90114 TaxID=2493665 RepID=UPI0013E8F8B4|nr:SpoIIE family protein phosphatase [Ammoniphilus sp. CFH 90114]
MMVISERSFIQQVIDEFILEQEQGTSREQLQRILDKICLNDVRSLFGAIFVLKDTGLSLMAHTSQSVIRSYSYELEKGLIEHIESEKNNNISLYKDSLVIPLKNAKEQVGFCIIGGSPQVYVWQQDHQASLAQLQYIMSLLLQNVQLTERIEEKEVFHQHFVRLLEGSERAITQFDLSFLSTILHEVMKVVPEADYGSISIIRGDKWEFVDAIGHNIELLKSIPLRYEYESINYDLNSEDDSPIYIVNRILDIQNNSLIVPSEVKDSFLEASKPIKETLMVKMSFGGRLLGQISLDIAEGSSKAFSKESKEKLVPYKQLTSIFLMFYEAYTTGGKYQEIINLSSGILTSAENQFDSNAFLSKLLKIALQEIPEADCGSISIVEDNVWTFVDAMGHDIHKLRELKLTSEYMANRLTYQDQVTEVEKNVYIIQNTLLRGDGNIPDELVDRFTQASRPIKESMQVNIFYADQLRGMISLDIEKGNNKSFSKKYVKMLQMIGEIGSIFLAYKQSYDMIGKFEKLTGLATKLVVSGTNNDMGFLQELLKVALEQITEADYGSISIVDGEDWKFVDAVGHDLAKLQALPLKKEYLIDICDINNYEVDGPVHIGIIHSYEDLHTTTMPDDLYEPFFEASKPMKSSMLIEYILDGEVLGTLSIDIAKDSLKVFSLHSYRLFKAIGNLAFAFVAFTQFTKKQQEAQEEIERWNQQLEFEVEERTSELTQANQKMIASLKYAKRIQDSILPTESHLRRVLDHHFILWMPRDIVGGDFYWMKELEDGYLIGIGDCTGHGVPGALMSMVSVSILNQLVEVENLKQPNDILSRLNKMLKRTLNQETEYGMTDDGLDIGICFVKPNENLLYYSGAKCNLYTINGGNLSMIKGNRKSIGYRRTSADYSFDNITIPIKANQSYYLTTDGYIDQNGGPKDLSFGRHKFEALIQKVYALPLSSQQDAFLSELHAYMGKERQRDDITVLGFRP